MYCTRCGTKNTEEAGFCRNCSSPLTKPINPPRSQGTYATPPPYAASNNPSSPTDQLPYPGYQGYPVYQGGQNAPANYPAGQQAGASGRAIASLVLSILGLVGCMYFASIPGMILGKMEMNAIREGKAPQAGDAIAKVGFYMGIAATVIYGLGTLVFILIFFIGLATNSHP